MQSTSPIPSVVPMNVCDIRRLLNGIALMLDVRRRRKWERVAVVEDIAMPTMPNSAAKWEYLKNVAQGRLLLYDGGETVVYAMAESCVWRIL